MTGKTEDAAVRDSVTERRYAAETARQVTRQLPAVLLVFLGIFGGAGIFEINAHPERMRLYFAVLLGEVVTLMAAVLLTRGRRGQTRAIPITACACGLICVLIGSYHVIAGGEAEILALALIGMATCVAVLLPLGGWGQLVVGVAAFGSFVIAVLLGVRGANSVWMIGTGLSSVGVLTVAGTFMMDSYRYASFRRAEELQHLNAALAAANETKNAFLASVSHELRTPLNVIVGYVQLMLDGTLGPLPEPVKEPLQRVAVNVETLIYLISDLLDLSRMEAGRLTVQVSRVELAPLFADVSEFARVLIGNKPIRFICEPAGDFAVSADRERLRQILSNLLSNAVKFTPQGEVSLSARTTDSGQIEITVADTGIGIVETDLRRVFEPFHRSSNAAEVGGVGIGLAVSELLAHLIGGDMSVESTPARGSVFRLRLQLAAPVVAATGEEVQVSVA